MRTDSVMLASAIEAYEGRVAGTVFAKVACLYANQDDFTAIRFRNEQAEVMCDIDESCKEHVAQEGKNQVLHLMISKASYGEVRAALLWCKLLISKLLKKRFKLNPHDSCVANKTINNNQCTICHHVDDTKVSYAELNVVEDVLNR